MDYAANSKLSGNYNGSNIALYKNGRNCKKFLPFLFCHATVENPRFYRGKKKA